MSSQSTAHQCSCGDHKNILLPKAYPILAITKHTELEWNFRVAKDFDAKLGQFVEVSLPMVGEAPISVSDCGDDYVDLLIRNVGKVTNRLFELNVGDNVWMRGVHGNGYPIEHYHHRHLVIIAGGTGVAPVKGLMRHFSEHPEKVNGMDMILGFKNKEAVLYRDEMPLWRERQNLITTLDEGEEDEEFHLGLVTAHIDKLDLSDLANTQAIVVGPPIMIKFAVQALLKEGLTKQQIWVDYERRMACAVGKCGHCRMGEKYVCIDGPVFRFDEAEHLVD
ncbi:anaerobic sulfite reductase subunit AsrB [Photobacterium leiognathi]|uniref:anaerobic sulfite reductase subunit AsrB n=1 Tax=Photobacterium leiognathi TaxID=553611 RepID=UPI001EDE97B0|nr:anaerobic sulfite reductase subunit AsrB [Photobacterium leiognathi]MCG3883220.1 anaerobic sulfite reductase subunit AsrB [Photobacterium leiognathi]